MAHGMARMAAKVAVAMAAVAGMAACGGGASRSASVGPAGGTVVAAGVRVTFPAGALARETQIEVSELPRKEGEPKRVHVGPDDAALAKPATLVVKSDDGNAADEKLVELDPGAQGEVEHGREAEIEHLGEFELREAKTCDVACDPGFECDDGVCKLDPEDDPAGASSTASSSCPAGMELDPTDGFCKPHGGSGK